ncbi:cytochrome p450 [Moniliophthora roreri MCA 2997]|uniref:Cytochrome p450 n=1 Tax=Moniliophthora roreri (strain MCA 2997) TaxID=1381753 RepID=V2WX21_MONRO|nr:cytochrome p450 [Moniliophthora roreri MCA 2997]
MSLTISTCVLLLVIFVFQVLRLAQLYCLQRALLDIPSVGKDSVLSSYATSYRWVKDAWAVLHDGYNRYKDKGFFKVPQINSWILIATGPNIKDLCSVPDASVSLHAAIEDLLQPDYTPGKEIHFDMYHLGDMVELNKTSSQWTSISANDTFMQFICCIMNWTFVGVPLCCNKDYCNINIYFAHHVMFGSVVINLFPNFLKLVVGAIYNKILGLWKCIVIHVGPLIEEQQKLKCSSNPVPDDMLTWLIEAAPPNH